MGVPTAADWSGSGSRTSWLSALVSCDGRSVARLGRRCGLADVDTIQEFDDVLTADLGCGPGHVARFLAARHTDMIGIDLSSAVIDIAPEPAPEMAFAVGINAVTHRCRRRCRLHHLTFQQGGPRLRGLVVGPPTSFVDRHPAVAVVLSGRREDARTTRCSRWRGEHAAPA
ncbi:methyltransferase domain-containing protein [Nonomuraea fuscirosea]|uniref:methyltransferase domain-containing protein n=1 Tax=Nonomuraea fuscirosea TaxID=1291556 RepID=UPI003CCBBD4E